MYHEFLNFNITRRGSRPRFIRYSISQDIGIIRFFMKKYGIPMRSAYAMYGRFVLTGKVE